MRLIGPTNPYSLLYSLVPLFSTQVFFSRYLCQGVVVRRTFTVGYIFQDAGVVSPVDEVLLYKTPQILGINQLGYEPFIRPSLNRYHDSPSRAPMRHRYFIKIPSNGRHLDVFIGIQKARLRVRAIYRSIT
jgi:hypothetical protein